MNEKIVTNRDVLLKQKGPVKAANSKKINLTDDEGGYQKKKEYLQCHSVVAEVLSVTNCIEL